jgi:hypothetical protein
MVIPLTGSPLNIINVGHYVGHDERYMMISAHTPPGTKIVCIDNSSGIKFRGKVDLRKFTPNTDPPAVFPKEIMECLNATTIDVGDMIDA